MSESDAFFGGLTVGIYLGLLCIVLCTNISTPDSEVTSGKQFILKDATYICKKTNELKGE